MPTTATSLSTIATAIESALAAGNSSLAQELATVFHLGTTTTTGVNYKDKTMTATWWQANQTAALPLIAAGWTIIPG